MEPVRSAAAIICVVLSLLSTGCGDGGSAAPAGQQSRAATSSRSAAAAVQPTGSSSRLVSYRCASGRESTLAVDVPDLRHLADQLNRIQVCEYDHGVSDATLTVRCEASPLVVNLAATRGEVVQPSDDALCL